MGRIYETYVKRALDVALSGCALAVLSPVMGVTALLVRQKLGSPVIFCQERPGKDEQIFKLYKFRTMTDARGADGNLLPDAQRLTPFGRRHAVRPGLTGLAQVNGRNLTSWAERFAYDVDYVDHISFALDAKIVLMTIQCVLSREGISAEGSATMETFTGTGAMTNE